MRFKKKKKNLKYISNSIFYHVTCVFLQWFVTEAGMWCRKPDKHCKSLKTNKKNHTQYNIET